MICQFFADWTWYLRLWPNHECLSLINLTYLGTWNQIFEILVVYYSSYLHTRCCVICGSFGFSKGMSEGAGITGVFDLSTYRHKYCLCKIRVWAYPCLEFPFPFSLKSFRKFFHKFT